MYKRWLEKYLNWIDPKLWEQIETFSFGPKVKRLKNRFAAEDLASYEFNGVTVCDPQLIELPMTHKLVSTAVDFGEKDEEGTYHPYVVGTAYNNPTSHTKYDK